MHVVIVEDEVVVARRLERLVRSVLGDTLARIDLCAELHTATELLGNTEHAIVLLDLNLAGRDGFDLLRRAVAEPFQTLAGRVDLVAVDSVIAIHGADDYSELETAHGRRHLHKKTLTQLERLLPPRFVRVHRSHIVNLKHATRIGSENGARCVELSNGTTVPVGRAYAARLAERML